MTSQKVTNAATDKGIQVSRVGIILPKRQWSKLQLIAVSLAVGIAGTILVVLSHAATATATYSGTLLASSPSVIYPLASSAGNISAALTFSTKGASKTNSTVMSLAVKDASGTVLGVKTGSSSPLALTATANANGIYNFTVSGTNLPKNGIGYTLTITYPPQDTIPPTVALTAPVAGATLAGTIQVIGTASDNSQLAGVSVRIDGNAPQTASGTNNWNLSLNTAGYSDGPHTITATASDTSGNTSAASEQVTFQNAGTIGAWTNLTLTDPTTANSLAPAGRGKQAEWGSLSAVVYAEQFTSRKAVYFRDTSSGGSAYISLPLDTTTGWSNASLTMTSGSDLWIESGDGPIYVRHYSFSGSPLPNVAKLVSSWTFGTVDSRHGDITKLSNGGVVVVWHQQGAAGPQGQYVAYLPSGAAAWQTIGPLTFMPTASSGQVVVQHPADSSVWLFADPDTYGSIGAAHFDVGANGLVLDWTSAAYINSNEFGDYGPDPEFPDLAVQPDTSTNTLALAYQDAHRVMFNTNTTGSYVAIAHIPPTGSTPAAGSITFTQMPVFVERTSALALVVQPNAMWLAYRPIDTVTLTYNELYANCYCNGAWQTATHLGTFHATSDTIGYGVSRPEFSTELNDGKLHLFIYR